MLDLHEGGIMQMLTNFEGHGDEEIDLEGLGRGMGSLFGQNMPSRTLARNQRNYRRERLLP